VPLCRTESVPGDTGGGLAKKQLLALFGHHVLCGKRLSLRVGPLRSRTCCAAVESTTKIYEIVQILLLPLPGNDPRIRCHIRDRLDLALRCGLDPAGANSARIVDQDVKATECVGACRKVSARPSTVPTSAAIPVTDPPALPNSSTAAETKAARRPEIATLAAFAKRALAIAKPMPLEPRVMRTRFPASFMTVVLIRPADSSTGTAPASLRRH
jgi:hypothetical protein